MFKIFKILHFFFLIDITHKILILLFKFYLVKQEVTKQEENSEWDKTDEEILLKDNTKGRRNRRKLKIKDENDEDEDEGK